MVFAAEVFGFFIVLIANLTAIQGLVFSGLRRMPLSNI